MIPRDASALILRSSYICPSCTRRLRPMTATVQKRNISQKYLQKESEAKKDWAKKAEKIKAGDQESMLTMLEKRGYVNQIVGDRDDLDRLMTEKRVGIYVGIDPTAPSMHVGHLLPLMVLYWAYIKGFHACSLLGGATAQIGDPIGRTASRVPQRSADRKLHTTRIHLQLKTMWINVEKHARDYGYEWEWAWRRELTNNNAWLNKLTALELLKYLGSGVRLGTMLGKDTVKNRMKQGEGMSFAEFAYPLLQSWDWWYMYDTKGIQVQVGGADQFGNILAGIEAVNHVRHNIPRPQENEEVSKKEAFLEKPMGFTVPLLTTASGEKFGKSAGNAIWLDREMTSAFDLYQFFLRMADADVHRYLKLLTFEPLNVLENLMEEHEKEPSKRVAQHKLAREVLEIVHGGEIAKRTEQEHRSLFRRPSVGLPPVPLWTAPPKNGRALGDHTREEQMRPINKDWGMEKQLKKAAEIVNLESAPSVSLILPKSLVYKQPISRVLYHAGMVSSRGEGHRLIANKGVYLGARPGATGTMGNQVDFSPAANWDGSETERYILGGDTLTLRVGKWKVKIIKIINDEDFEAQGLSVPGWKEERPEKPLTHDLQRMKPWHRKGWVERTPMHHKDERIGEETPY